MTFYLFDHSDSSAQDVFLGHISSCPVCKAATSIKNACTQAQHLHNEIVIDAQKKQRTHVRVVDLADIINEKQALEAITVARELADISMPSIQGVDVSIFQGNFNWNEAVSVGIGLGIAKTSEGNGYIDPQWANNVAALLAPGPIVGGSYHFARPDLGNTPQAEAQWYLSQHPSQCFSPTIPWVFSLDAESAGGSASWVYGFLDSVSSKIGYSCWFYSFQNWIQTRGVQAFNRPLWIAWPNSGAPPNEGWPVVTMQQYGARQISGASVDADLFLGDRPTLFKLGGVDLTSSSPVKPASPKPAQGDAMGYFSFRPGGPNDRWDMVFTVQNSNVNGGTSVSHAWGDSISGLFQGQNGDGSPTGYQDCGAPTLPPNVSLVPGTAEIGWNSTGNWNQVMVQASDGTWWGFWGNLDGVNQSGWQKAASYNSLIPAQKGAPGPAGPATFMPHTHKFTETDTGITDSGTPS